MCVLWLRLGLVCGGSVYDVSVGYIHVWLEGCFSCVIYRLEGSPLLGEGFVRGVSMPFRACRSYGFLSLWLGCFRARFQQLAIFLHLRFGAVDVGAEKMLLCLLILSLDVNLHPPRMCLLLRG